jgi:fructose-1,6-bisphosphatase/inositol monophosphatase family enzyme
MNLEQVRSWAREAGEIGLRHYNQVETRYKPDRSVVTDADEEIERLLRARIQAVYPDHGIVGEEGKSVNLDADYVWALDPIDGTGVFVAGLPMWGVSIGLLRRGHPVLGCFYLPVLNDWYEADLDGPALFNGEPVSTISDDLLNPNAWIAVPSNVHRRYEIAYPGKARSLGSLAADVCYVARGSAVGALIGQPKLWDIAAAMVVLQRAGGALRLLHSGQPLDPRALLTGQPAPEPVVCGSPAALELLLDRVKLRARQ